MNNEMYKMYFARLLHMAQEGDAAGRQTRPIRTFNEMRQAGELDALSPADRETVRHMAEEMSAFFWNRRELDISSEELLWRSIARVNLNEGAISEIAGILAGCLANTELGPKEPLTYDFKAVEMPFALPAVVKRGAAADAGLDAGVLEMSPQQISDRLGLSVWGQHEARRAMALLLHHHVRGLARSLVLAGPTACGKSQLALGLRSLYGNVVDVDGSQLSAEGWKGEVKLSGIFAGMSKGDAEHAIVVIDEADKLFEPKTSGNGENYSYQVQNELLKLMDGGFTKTTVKNERGANVMQTISARHMSFVFMGSFESMLRSKGSQPNEVGFNKAVRARGSEDYHAVFTSEDLVRYAGVRREVAGRMGHIVQMFPLTEDDYLAILDDPLMSPLVRLESEYGLSLALTQTEKRKLARTAVNSGLGVRSLEAQVEDLLDEKLFASNEPAADA